MFAVRTVDVAGAPPARRDAGAAGARRRRGRRACSRSTSTRRRSAVEALPTVAARDLRPRLPAHAPRRRRAGAPGGGRPPGRRRLPRRRERPRDGARRAPASAPRWRGSGSTARSCDARAGRDGDRATCARAVDGRRTARRLAASRAASRSVTATAEALTLRLRSGLEVRLGDAADVALKLAVAARVIPLLAAGTPYLDVAVPERPVAGQPSTLRLRLRLHPRRHLEISVDNADKESVPWLRMPGGAHSISSMRA